MNNKSRAFYFLSLGVILAASAYPIHMGVKTMLAYRQFGAVNAADYPKYIIPYTPLSIALILVVTLMPWFYLVFKKYSLPILSLLGTVAFLICERYLETIKVLIGVKESVAAVAPDTVGALSATSQTVVTAPIESWQLGLCASISPVLKRRNR